MLRASTSMPVLGGQLSRNSTVQSENTSNDSWRSNSDDEGEKHAAAAAADAASAAAEYQLAVIPPELQNEDEDKIVKRKPKGTDVQTLSVEDAVPSMGTRRMSMQLMRKASKEGSEPGDELEQAPTITRRSSLLRTTSLKSAVSGVSEGVTAITAGTEEEEENLVVVRRNRRKSISHGAASSTLASVEQLRASMAANRRASRRISTMPLPLSIASEEADSDDDDGEDSAVVGRQSKDDASKRPRRVSTLPNPELQPVAEDTALDTTEDAVALQAEELPLVDEDGKPLNELEARLLRSKQEKIQKAIKRMKSTMPTKKTLKKNGKDLEKEVATHLLPLSVKALDFPKAEQFFRQADKMRANGGTGALDPDAFYTMLCQMTRDKEPMTREWSDKIFSEIDADGGGTIEREEYLGWVFQTNNNYLSGVRSRLEAMDPGNVKELFAEIDTDFNGSIDKEEFWVFVQNFAPGEMSRQASDELHEFIDRDGSGGIDLEEFLNWIHPGRELRMIQGFHDQDNAYKRAERERKGGAASGNDVKLIEKDGFDTPNKPLMEMQHKNPVILQFTCGKLYEPELMTVKTRIRQVFDATQVRFSVVRDPSTIHYCTKCEAKVGRGIVLWDRQTMLPYNDDPFETQAVTEKWLRDVLMECLPDVIAAANLRRIKKRKKALKTKKSVE